MENGSKLLRMCNSCLSIDVSLGNNRWMERKANPELYDQFMAKFKGNVTGAACSGGCIEEYNNLPEEEQEKIDKERTYRLSNDY